VHCNPTIFLSYFHEYLMRKDSPDIAAEYDALHAKHAAVVEHIMVDIRALEAQIAAKYTEIEVDEGELEDFIKANKLKKAKKPQDCDPADYRRRCDQIIAGTYRTRDYLDMTPRKSRVKLELDDLFTKLKR
jgi:hypothetical protein